MWDLNLNAQLLSPEITINLKLKHPDDFKTYVNIADHPDPTFNGDYYRDGYWNAKPHFVNSESMHLYYYNHVGHTHNGYWQIDHRDQWDDVSYPGANDWYDGGWWYSSSEIYDYVVDLNTPIYAYYE